ncbi:MAG: hypothetical protein FWE65_02095 [Eggerthellaceae bacterium]|nr:hypothetical protein [Eggerthellaceae bacterium]
MQGFTQLRESHCPAKEKAYKPGLDNIGASSGVAQSATKSKNPVFDVQVGVLL